MNGGQPRDVRRVYPSVPDPSMTQQVASSVSKRSKSVSSAAARRAATADPRWATEWEHRPLHGNGGSGRRLMNGPALRRVDPPLTNTHRSDSHERPRPVSTGRVLSSSRQQQRDRDIVAAARQLTGEPKRASSSSLRHQQSSSSIRSTRAQDPNGAKDSGSPLTADTSTSSNSPNSHSTEAVAVTRTIRDLRDNRDRYSRNKRDISTARRRLRQQSLVDDASAEEERQATQRLKHAEGKITTLMQELDELRFFSEIEAEQSSPPPNGGADKTVVQGPVTALSPRRLAGLDRTSLELEAQQLQRQVDILEREKATLDATIKLQKASASSHEEDLKRIRKLEQTLKTVQQELSHQLDEIQSGRTKLTHAYEEKLRTLHEQYCSSKDTADDLLHHLEETQEALETLDKRHAKLKEDVALKLKEKETALQRQEEEWKKQVADRDAELSKLHDELVEATMSLEAMQTEKEESYEPRLRELERQWKEEKSQHESLLTRCEEIVKKLEERDADLERARGEIDEQAKELRETQSLLEQEQSQHAAELAELKTSLETREKRRLDDLVVLQQDSNQEYERRLKSLQQQLTLATDRHQMEMEQKEKSWQAKLEATMATAKREIREEYEPKLRDSMAELALIQIKYEEAKQESLIAQVKAESKDRDLAREWERKDAIRQSELEIMHDKLDRTVRELAEKEARIQTLQEKVNESELRSNSSLVDLETRHAEELAEREELLSNHRKLWKASEGKLRMELARKESELLSLQESFGADHGKLAKELEETRKALDEAKKNAENAEVLKQKLATMQYSFEQVQKEFSSEQARHESLEEDLRVQLAKMEGRLSATETSLIEKKIALEDLEQRLSIANEESSTAGSKYEHTILSLKAELEAVRNTQTIQQSTLADKDASFAKLEAARKEDLAKLERLSALEKKVLTLQRALSEVETEKEVQADELAKLKEERQRDADALEDTARKILVDKEEISLSLERKDDEIKKLTESHSNTIAELNARLAEEYSAKTRLQLEVETLNESLKSANEVSISRSVDSTVFQQRINELEAQIEKQRLFVSKNVTDSQETVTLLTQQLAEAQKAQEEVTEKLQLLANEKDEVVEALEQVINEVQGRDEEIESLTDILEKRDEELEHAKIIATKAIAQSQEIQAKYKERGERDSVGKANLVMQIDSLNASLDFLTSKNEELQKKVTRLEEELQDKTLECKMLANDGTSPRDYGPTNKSRNSAAAEKETKDSPLQLSPLQRKLSREAKKRENAISEFSPFDNVESESNKRGHASSKSVDVDQTSQWFADFADSDSRSDFLDANSEPGINKSRQSIERDALRKYVRKRYLKHTASR